MELIIVFFVVGLLMTIGGGLGVFYGLFKANNKLLGFILSIFALAIAMAGFEIVKILWQMDIWGLITADINALIS